MTVRKRSVDPRFGQRLKQYRQHRKLTVRRLADQAQVSPGTIADYEAGRIRIPVERLVQFAAILEVLESDFFAPPTKPLRRRRINSHRMKLPRA